MCISLYASVLYVYYRALEAREMGVKCKDCLHLYTSIRIHKNIYCDLYISYRVLEHTEMDAKNGCRDMYMNSNLVKFSISNLNNFLIF